MNELPAGYRFADEPQPAPQAQQPVLPEGYQFAPEAPTAGEAIGEDASKLGAFIEDVASDWDKRAESIEESRKARWERREIGGVEQATQALGAVAGGFLDLTGRAVVAGIEVLVPDSLEEPLLDAMASSFDWLMNTEAGEAASQAFGQGYDAYAEWKKENPQDAKTFESVVNIGLIAAPAKVKSKASPVPSFGRTATKVERAGIKQKAARTRRQVQDMLFPEKPTAEMVARTKQEGFIRRNVLDLTNREKQMIDNVMKIPEVKTSRSYQYNYNAIRNANQAKANQLKADLDKMNIVIHPETVQSGIAANLDNLLKTNHYLASDKQMANHLQLNIKTAQDILAKHPPTPSGLLDARREFDRVLRNQMPKAFDPKAATVQAESARLIRSTINDTINSSARSQHVKKRLTEQHTLYNAMDMLAPKAMQEASHGMGRLWQNLSRAMQVKMDMNRTWAVIAGTSAFSAAGGMLAGLSGGLALGAVGVMAVKGYQSPSTKIALGKILKMTDQAIQKSTNPDMIRQLRADRAIAQDLFELPVQEEEEQ